MDENIKDLEQKNQEIEQNQEPNEVPETIEANEALPEEAFESNNELINEDVQETATEQASETVEIIESNNEMINEEEIVNNEIISEETEEDSEISIEEELEEEDAIEFIQSDDSDEIPIIKAPEFSDLDEEEEEEPMPVLLPAFDWTNLEDEEEVYSSDERKNLEQMYTKTFKRIEDMQLLKASVVNITDKDVVLNIGYKSDGLVALSEFKHMEDLKVGDIVDVVVESTEGKGGQIILSHKKARAEASWNRIEIAHESGEIVTGYIKDRTKGGMVVDLFGLDAFLPGSQLDIKPVQDYDIYVGRQMDLKVVKLNPAFRNIVVSHKAIIEQDMEEQRHKILSKLEKGQILEGVVKNLTSFGVFVDLGGVDGLIHITDVSWGRINHPNEMLEVGQKINVAVLDYDGEKNRISLGMKQLTPHPWETLPEGIIENSILKGKVVNIEDYGAFVEIYPGVEGLVHVSEMTWSQHLKTPSDYLNLNDEVDVKVLSISREERKLSLGIKQLTPDPWEKVSLIYTKGSQHTSIVKNVTNFGLFVELEEGIDGLIHISDLSWTKKINHPSEFAKTGDTIEVVILESDEENRRLSLGHKQLEEDPWETFKDIFSIGSIHEGNIIKVDDKGALVTLPYGIEGFCPARQMIKENEAKVVVDEVLEFKVTEFDRSNRRVILSHMTVWKEAQKHQAEEENQEKKKQVDKTRKAISQVRSKVQKSTLGSEQDILQELKDKMVEAEAQTAKAKRSSSRKKDDEDSE